MTRGVFDPTFAAAGGIGDLTSRHGRLAQLQDASYATYVDTTASIIYDAFPGTKGNKWIVGRSSGESGSVSGDQEERASPEKAFILRVRRAAHSSPSSAR